MFLGIMLTDYLEYADSNNNMSSLVQKLPTSMLYNHELVDIPCNFDTPWAKNEEIPFFEYDLDILFEELKTCTTSLF